MYLRKSSEKVSNQNHESLYSFKNVADTIRWRSLYEYVRMITMTLTKISLN